MGPPESPEQESLPPAVRPAQNMLVVMAEVPYWARQVAREMTGTVTFLRLEGREEPLSVRRPLELQCQRSFMYITVKPCRDYLVIEERGGGSTHHPATTSSVPAAGSDPEAGSVAYPMVELDARGLARCQTATS